MSRAHRILRASAVAPATALTALLAGCGGGSPPAPVSTATLVSNLMTQSSGSHHGYATVLVTRGRGSKRFAQPSWPRHIAVQMSCRGAATVAFAVGRDVLVKVACSAGLSGGTRTTIGRVTTVSVIAPPRARWSLVVARRTR